MFKQFISLEWKSFTRAAAFKQNVAFKIFMGLGAVYMLFVMTGLGVGVFYGLKKLVPDQDPFTVLNRFLIYYFVFDLAIRYGMQKMPVANIRPLLYLPITRSQIVNFALGKTSISFFNILHAFFFIPYSIVLLVEGYDPIGVISWHLAIIGITYTLNYLNVFMNKMDSVFYPVVAVVIGLALLQYFGIFDVTIYTVHVFEFFYEQPWSFVIPGMVAALFYYLAYNYFIKQLYLDAGLEVKVKAASTDDLTFFDRFGSVSTFIKNDIRLIKRNKRARMTFIMGFLFLFYGAFFMMPMYADIPAMRIFAGLFVTGGFLLSFGGLVPSWDSSYYKLMMSQNIPYRTFLLSKWYLMVIVTCICSVLSLAYGFVGIEWLKPMIAAAIFNIGFNSSFVLLGGAFVKTPIDLQSAKKAFGDSKAFNFKTILLAMLKLFVPIAVYAAFAFTISDNAGYIAVAATGVIGLLLRNKIFDLIENIYKNEKYDTIAAYSQTN
ncbi:DUF5687 family protein [Nonlabens ponticola]|uniref:Uncharacterized protein n=1 Tax=Nonlabens ponticola TaxID=2496866 RepID=A0A3S9MVH2_9FLAO|nr:DUF5687 family protein [Nonlabens ponticola]AZQ43211.1 hypothetical protein EJ995_02785 [Nonlabens ponticola]